MSTLRFIPDILHSIRGSRFAFKVMQTNKGIPGFAPEIYEAEVCDIVVKYDAVEGDVPYLQFHDFSGTLSAKELEEIQRKMNGGYNEEEFLKVLEEKEYKEKITL